MSCVKPGAPDRPAAADSRIQAVLRNMVLFVLKLWKYIAF